MEGEFKPGVFYNEELQLTEIILGEFKPGVFYNEELQFTEIILADVFTIWSPLELPIKGHVVDLGYDVFGQLIAIKVWKDVRTNRKEV